MRLLLIPAPSLSGLVLGDLYVLYHYLTYYCINTSPYYTIPHQASSVPLLRIIIEISG